MGDADVRFVQRLTRDGLHRRVGGILKEVREGGWEEFRRVRVLKARLAEARVIVRQNAEAFADSPEVWARIDATEHDLHTTTRLAAEHAAPRPLTFPSTGDDRRSTP